MHLSNCAVNTGIYDNAKWLTLIGGRRPCIGLRLEKYQLKSSTKSVRFQRIEIEFVDVTLTLTEVATLARTAVL